jgi:plasmid maintenance system antidote protein VapI
MLSVTDDIRTRVKKELEKQGLTISGLAQEFEVERSHLSRLINRSGVIPKAWLQLLDRLGLELAVQPKRKK